MQSTTSQTAGTNQWQMLLSQLPADLEERAQRRGALVRRRGIRSAIQLLQIVLAYAIGDYSLRQVGLWATLSEVAEVSDVTILNRLRQSVSWLEELVAYLLNQRIVAPAQRAVRLCLVDATVLSQPGSRGSDWRIHLSFDAAQMQVDSLSLTSSKVGEGLHHFAFAPGTIVVADRAYGYKKQLLPLLQQGISYVVRVRWTNLAEFTYQNQPFALLDWLRTTFRTPEAATHAIELHLPTQQGSLPMRLVACQLPPQAAEQARRRMQRKRQKKGEKPTAESLYVAGFVLLLTNLPAESWRAAQVGEIYRYRWQVELYFKRLKSIVHLDHLRAHDPQLARAYLWGKLLAALLLDRLAQSFVAVVPAWLDDPRRPLSRWRLLTLLWSSMHSLFTLPMLLLLWHTDPARLRRYLCDSPRKRPQQATLVRLLMRSLSVVNVLPSLS